MIKPEVTMTTEPSAAGRQELAFDHLREQARKAHFEGDGLLVNNLCAVALSHFSELAKKDSLKLSLGKVKWACIFPLYWLFDDLDIRGI